MVVKKPKKGLRILKQNGQFEVGIGFFKMILTSAKGLQKITKYFKDI